jgi:hypothetical protein
MEKFASRRGVTGGLVFLCLLLMLVFPLRSEAGRPVQKVTPPLAKAAQTEHFSQKTRYIRHGLDVNDFRIPMTNYAVFGQFIDLGAAGGEWPKGSNEYYIFGAGIWVGGTVNNPTLHTLAFSNAGSKRDTVLFGTINDPRVAIGYNPSGGAQEMSGLTDIFITGHPEDYGDNPDYWPLRDNQGNPIIVGIQDSYCAFDDQDPERWDTGINSNAGDGHDIAKYGLGVQVIQSTHSWDYENNKTIHFFVFDIVNIREDKAPIRNCFLSVMCDADIGPTANDDLVGFDHGRNLGYCYDSDEAEQGFARKPGYLAYKFLESPIATYDVDLNGDDQISNDSIDVNSDGVLVGDVRRGQRLGLTSFKTSNLQSGDPDTEPEKYLIMAGHNYPDVGDQRYAPFDLGTGNTPVDQRFFQNTGPFLLVPPGETAIDTVWKWNAGSQSLTIASIDTVVGDTVRVVVAVMMAPDETTLPQVADIAQSIYDIGFILPRPPTHPNVRVIPDDQKVYLVWDNVAEQSADPYFQFTSDPTSPLYDPLYREYDFEGYKLYRSSSGLPGTFELLGSWDKISNTPRHVDIEQVAGVPFQGQVTYDEANTEGYILAFGGSTLFSGHEYFIQVTSDLTFSVTDRTLGAPVPPSEEEDHWYNTGEPPYVFELFDADFNSMSTPENILDGTYDKYFDGVNLLVGGMVINFTGDTTTDVPTESMIFRVNGHLEEVEGLNTEPNHSYLDEGLTNGITYYYDVIAYDFQPFFEPRSLENGITPINATPRSNATGVTQATAFDVTHTQGSSSGSVEVAVVEPDSVTGDRYEVGFYDGEPPLLWYLKDLDKSLIVLDSVSNQSGNEDYPVVNGLVVKAVGPSPGISSWEYIPSDDRWITGVNWGGTYFYGGLDLGPAWGWGAVVGPADYVTVEMRFDSTETQKGYRYVRPGYGYGGFFEVPFTAWDVTAVPERQINIAFVENQGSAVFDSTWDPDNSDDGGREYLFIMKSDYDPNGGVYNDENWAPELDNLYAGWFKARSDAEGNSRTWTDGDVFRITPYFVNLVQDKFTFNTSARKLERSLVDLNDIKVVPNPYIVRNLWERSDDYSVLAFTHLPDKCTIRIYTLSGDHLITLEHDSPQMGGNENWNLLTKNRQKIAAGIYIFHVDSPYGEKIGKFAVIR